MCGVNVWCGCVVWMCGDVAWCGCVVWMQGVDVWCGCEVWCGFEVWMFGDNAWCECTVLMCGVVSHPHTTHLHGVDAWCVDAGCGCEVWLCGVDADVWCGCATAKIAVVRIGLNPTTCSMNALYSTT